MRTRLAITGIGLVDNLGSDAISCYQEYISEHYTGPVDGYFSAVEIESDLQTRRLLPVNKLSLHATKEATRYLPDSKNVFTLFSTLTAGNTTFTDYGQDLLDGKNRVKPKTLLQGCRDFTAGLIARTNDFTGGAASFNSACATSAYQIDYAFALADEYDYIVCGAADSSNNQWDATFFDKLGALGTKSAPFCDTRDGIIPGEAAACLILECEEKAKTRGAFIYGYVHKPALASDGITGDFVHPKNTGLKLAMTKALSRVDTEQIAFVSAHATGTPVGDVLEYDTIQECLPNVPVVGLKSKLGHTMAPNAIAEIIYSLLALLDGVIPQTHNISSTECDHVVTKLQETKRKYALKNSLGFGGKAASIIIEANSSTSSPSGLR